MEFSFSLIQKKRSAIFNFSFKPESREERERERAREERG
jgi:hypothetical protein